MSIQKSLEYFRNLKELLKVELSKLPHQELLDEAAHWKTRSLIQQELSTTMARKSAAKGGKQNSPVTVHGKKLADEAVQILLSRNIKPTIDKVIKLLDDEKNLFNLQTHSTGGQLLVSRYMINKTIKKTKASSQTDK
jgi:uncharacterized protein YqgQ